MVSLEAWLLPPPQALRLSAMAAVAAKADRTFRGFFMVLRFLVVELGS
jgi:hypothetical protein